MKHFRIEYQFKNKTTGETGTGYFYGQAVDEIEAYGLLYERVDKEYLVNHIIKLEWVNYCYWE